MGQLYIVSTPIGNLADISYRAVDILGAVKRVLAEDTRRTAILFRHYGIATPLYSAHAHNELARVRQVLAWLQAGEDVALVSDAGTPLLSDPGARIVAAVLEAGHEVIPVPGASALLAGLVGSGLETQPFTFLGFLPRSGPERRDALEQIEAQSHTMVIYESPARLLKLLQDLLRVCGPERRAVVARELTKLNETFVRGTVGELAAYYATETVRGEVVVMIAGTEGARGGAEEEAAESRARTIAREQLAQGSSARDVAKLISKEVGLARNRAYEITQALLAGGETS
jgi:16S rRNA (cytidine1402-2'-O)-methyltransferase